MEKINVFISYSHKNKELRDEVLRTLGEEINIEALYDEKDIQVGYAIHEKISAMLDMADIIIAIATEEWLQSNETREEFIRANERRKYLICFADESTNLDSLPQFIRDAKQIRFSKNEKINAIKSLVPTIEVFARTRYFRKQRIYARLRQIANEVHKSNPAFYRLNLAHDHIEHALEETQNILGNGVYSIDIGNENGYLLKAISIFESASYIYAVSLTGVSTFWDDKKYTDKAVQYLEKQSKDKIKIIRLFVFSNCTQVNDYKNILQANHIAYGEKGKGAVLMCSKKTYEAFIKAVARTRTFGNVFDDDFGILAYSDNGREEHFIEARLDNNVFTFRPISINHVAEAGINRFITKLQQIETALGYGEFIDEFKILRWDPSFISDRDVFAGKIASMFDEKEDIESIIHLAVFKNCFSQEVSEGLYELVNKLKGLNGGFFNFERIELMTKTKVQAFDGKFGTELLFNEDIDYIMLMEFSKERYLSEYYTHTEHSSEREKIYSIVNPSIIEHYNKLKALKRSEANYHTRASDIYEKIEELMAKYFFRLDIRKFEIPALIVHQRGIPFSHLNH